MTPSDGRFRAGASVRTAADVQSLLDELLDERGSEARWDRFFADRTRAVPFFVDAPDETLVADFERGALVSGRVLELGCGNGRNAVYLAGHGCAVDAVDVSETAIAWARERARAATCDVRFVRGSIFDLEVAPGSYDLVYDSGCFHHVAPHRRPAYLELVSTALAPGGVLSLVCFRPEGGSERTDLQVYERGSLGGGLGFSEARLREIFAPSFEVAELRRMTETDVAAERFGRAFLQSARFVKR